MAEYVSKHRIANLNVFASTVWGNAEAVLKQGNPIGVDYVDITQYMDAFEFLLGPAIPYYRKILIREEYRIALHALETKLAYRQAAYVTGQPGIGKSQVTFLEALKSSLVLLISPCREDTFPCLCACCMSREATSSCLGAY